VVRGVDGKCGVCEAHNKTEAKARQAAAANAGHYAPPSWRKKILSLGDKVLGEQPGSFAPLAAAGVVVKYGANIPNPTRGRRIRPGPPNLAGRRRPLKATALLGPDDIPSIIIEEPEENESKEKLGKSWSIGDDLPYQQEPCYMVKTINLPAPVSQLDTLPSQFHPLRQNPPGSGIQRQSTRQRQPNPSTIYKVERETGRKPATATATATPRQQKLARKPLPPRPQEKYAIELPSENTYQMKPNTAFATQQIPPRKLLPPTTAKKSFAEHVAAKGTTHMQPLPASASTYFSDPTQFRQPPFAAPPVFSATEIDGKAMLPKVNRHSRADEQAGELFLMGDYTTRQYDPKALAALHGGSQHNAATASTEVNRTPTILSAGPRNSQPYARDHKLTSKLFYPESIPRPTKPTTLAGERYSYHFSAEAPVSRAPTVLRPGHPDSTYVSPTVGQIPAYFNTHPASPDGRKESNRHAQLSLKEEESWQCFVSAHPTTPEMKIAGKPGFDLELPKLPKLPKLEPLSLSMQGKPKTRKEEIRLPSRISRPGVYNSYIASPKELPAASASKTKAGRGGVETEPVCTWDQGVLKACASIETISTTRSYAHKAV
jgi:hypothetical protein